jgi:hypothetical protein
MLQLTLLAPDIVEAILGRRLHGDLELPQSVFASGSGEVAPSAR